MEHVLTALENMTNCSNSFKSIFSSQQWTNFQNNQQGNHHVVQEILSKLEQLSTLTKDLEVLEKTFLAQEQPQYENLQTPYSFIWDNSTDKKPEQYFNFEINLGQKDNLSDSEFQYNNENAENTSYNEEESKMLGTPLDKTNDTENFNQQCYGMVDENKKKLFSSYDEILILQQYENKQMRQQLYSRLKQKNYQINAHYHSLQRQMKKNSLSLQQFIELKQSNLRVKRNQHQNLFTAEEQIMIIKMYPNKEERQKLFETVNHPQKTIKIKYNNILKEIRKNNLSIEDYVKLKSDFMIAEENIKLEETSSQDDINKVQRKPISKHRFSI